MRCLLFLFATFACIAVSSAQYTIDYYHRSDIIRTHGASSYDILNLKRTEKGVDTLLFESLFFDEHGNLIADSLYYDGSRYEHVYEDDRLLVTYSHNAKIGLEEKDTFLYENGLLKKMIRHNLVQNTISETTEYFYENGLLTSEVRTFTGRPGRRRSYVYDANGFVIEEYVDGFKSHTRYGRDEQGNMTSFAIVEDGDSLPHSTFTVKNNLRVRHELRTMSASRPICTEMLYDERGFI